MTIRLKPHIFSEKTSPSRADVKAWCREAIPNIVHRLRNSYAANGFDEYAELDIREIEAHLTDALSDATAPLVKALECPRG